jgi:hypothetical protein
MRYDEEAAEKVIPSKVRKLSLAKNQRRERFPAPQTPFGMTKIGIGRPEVLSSRVTAVFTETREPPESRR